MHFTERNKTKNEKEANKKKETHNNLKVQI